MHELYLYCSCLGWTYGDVAFSHPQTFFEPPQAINAYDDSATKYKSVDDEGTVVKARESLAEARVITFSVQVAKTIAQAKENTKKIELRNQMFSVQAILRRWQMQIKEAHAKVAEFYRESMKV